ncbi:MAG: nitrite/sulfite reductase [Bryobacterales bacterium]|nr:nitrite/sulfite reductase [Bryobacterales bacterium]
MKASNPLWPEFLQGRIPPQLASEIAEFESQIELKRQGRLSDKVFAETRLRRGVYGQRYDNGHRHDGIRLRTLRYPCGELTKGVNTVWDAPGMQRIKVPFGGLRAEQLEVVAELAEEYADGVAHVTTRQDFQLHFVHLEDTPTIMRRLAAVGLTTREACGNTVRNVTACPLSGVCREETFDVTPYAKACAYFLLGHPDCQNFGRKFKIAFSGCASQPCALARMHDVGLVARTVPVNGSLVRGFQVFVGGGLGPVPYQAKLYADFLPAAELLPTLQAIARVFAAKGEKRNRNRARLKFLVESLGIEEFRRAVEQERAALPVDPAWSAYLPEAEQFREVDAEPLTAPELPPEESDPAYRVWRERNVYRQRQRGYASVTVVLPLGDIAAEQLRALADIVRRYTPDTVRTTIEQNFLLRWVPESRLAELYADLARAHLVTPLAGTIADITACPGTDTCKLGIASSRGLARELGERLQARLDSLPAAAADLRIKVSGCFNSCGQHHVADIGFYGVSRNRSGHAAPYFQVLLGGDRRDNGCSYGLAIAAVPSRRVPEALDRILKAYTEGRTDGEDFASFARRKGKAALRALLEDLAEIPPLEVDPSLYVDWGDARIFSTDDLGVGECAGEVVTAVEFALARCEKKLLEAQILLENHRAEAARQVALRAMLDGAAALLEFLGCRPSEDSAIVERFRSELYDTQLVFDPFVGGTFADYFLNAWQTRDRPLDADSARRLLSEAQLFLDACHACHSRLMAARTARRSGGGS